MVQGAVDGAVNAADRHGRPHLVNHSFPRRPSRRGHTAAFKVLDSLFSAKHTSLQEAYALSLGAFRTALRKEQGVAVGTLAADARSRKGTTAAGGSRARSVGRARRVDAARRGRGDSRRVTRSVGRVREAVLREEPVAVPHPGPYDLTSEEYADDLDEVRSIGQLSTAQHAPATRRTLPRSGRRTPPRTTTLSGAGSSTSSRSM